MLVFNEGLPRSGKSYDAVASHILPALAQGRRVFARLNGLDDSDRRSKIAAYLSIDLDRLNNLLVFVPTSKVCETFVAVLDQQGEWVIPEHMQDGLFVIDEAHDFYVASRQPMPREVENFFALHGQNGMDGVVMTQWFRRMHSSVRARIERKNIFQKLSAVGVKGSYTVKRYHATAPERFEKVSTETKRYDPKIFPLYKGYADGSKTTDVYTAGGVTVWKRLRRLSYVAVPVFLIGLWSLWSFLHGDSSDFVHDNHHPSAQASSPSTRHASAAPANVLPVARVTHALPKHGDMPPPVAYVWHLTDQTRPRLVATMHAGDQQMGMVAWPVDRQTVLDRLTFRQLRDMGVTVRAKSYGVVLSWGDKLMVVTAWPMPDPTPAPSSEPADPSVAVTSTGSSVQATTTGSSSRLNHPVGIPSVAYVPPEYGKWDPSALDGSSSLGSSR